MIGVIFRENQKAMVEEFFELFKTPWEPVREGEYMMSSLRRIPAIPVPPARLLLVFCSDQCPWTIRMESGSIPL